MRACRFRYGFLCERISLAANMHSLVRSSKRMLERRQLLSYCGLAAVSFKEKILARPTPQPGLLLFYDDGDFGV